MPLPGSDNLRLSALLDFDVGKTASAAGGIEVPTNVHGVVLLTPQCWQAIVDWSSSDAASVLDLSENGDAL